METAQKNPNKNQKTNTSNKGLKVNIHKHAENMTTVLDG